MLQFFQAVAVLMQILPAAALKQICVACGMVIVMMMKNALLGSPVEIVAKTVIFLWEQDAVHYPGVKIVFPPRSILVKDIVTRTGSALALSSVVIILTVMKVLIIQLGQDAVNKVTPNFIIFFTHFLIIDCNYVLLYIIPIFTNLKQQITAYNFFSTFSSFRNEIFDL